jgi:hypothetical protein
MHVPVRIAVLAGAGLLLVVFIAILLKRRKKAVGRKSNRGNNTNLTRRLRTKFKILATFYQTVAGYENVLNLRFPPLFEKAARWLTSVSNFDALKLTSADCIMDTTFYTKLLFSTLLPVAIVVAALVFMGVASAFAKKTEKKVAIRNNCVEFILGLSFLVFASVSTTIFDTFNCVTYGDDPTVYLALDQTIECHTDTHKFYTMYASGMMLVYPIGIPFMYGYFLIRDRDEISSKDRYKNDRLIRTSFLCKFHTPSPKPAPT